MERIVDGEGRILKTTQTGKAVISITQSPSGGAFMAHRRDARAH